LSGSAGRRPARRAGVRPDPLPTDLPLDNECVRLLADADHAIGRLVGAVGRSVNPFLIASPLLHREAILSSRIEGTIATPQQLVLAEVGGLAAAEQEGDEPLEVLNYIHAMRHGLASRLLLSLRLIRDLHGVLMKGVRGGQDRPGEFREVQNFIGRPGASIAEARFVPAPVRAMHECLDTFEKRLHTRDEQLPLLVKLAPRPLPVRGHPSVPRRQWLHRTFAVTADPRPGAAPR
jgi:Fic family protein